VIEHTCDGDVHRLVMRDGENLFDPDFFRLLHQRLDAVEAEGRGDSALVLTGEGKYFSNGLNLPVIGKLDREVLSAFGLELMRTMGRLVVFPLPTVAAVNGHAFAGGALLAAACDYRVMRQDRGWLCMAEVDVGVPIDPALMALLEAKLTPSTLRTSVLEARRFTGPEALAAGWVDAVAPEAEVLAVATKRAAELSSKGRQIFASIKRSLWGDLAKRLGYDAGTGST
jgi:enoyl-CoA hydratase/carnithine racemase